ncbi:MAG: enoyl-CoA hydratase/isomerase family protein [Acidobacteriaceae bacterium]|nr:enoyl-CoA hydratase/isomerase family protein [Acidobacteriaceae bacterium]
MELLVEQKHRVLHVTLNRPEKRNALNTAICAELVKVIRATQQQPDVGAILLGANGPVFCAGMDLDEAAGMHDDDVADLHDDLFTIGANSIKPILACVNGAALGGGLGLVAQAHIVVAAQGAVFGLPEVRIGLWPFLVYRAVEAAFGARRTLELSLTGRMFSAHDAQLWGLVHHVCPPAEAADRAKTIAREIAKASPAAIAAGLQYFHASRGKSSKEAGQVAKHLRAGLMKSEDFHEGYEAFKQKRDPVWPGIPHHTDAHRQESGAKPNR